jgi:hypothetical protein
MDLYPRVYGKPKMALRPPPLPGNDHVTLLGHLKRHKIVRNCAGTIVKYVVYTICINIKHTRMLGC